MSHITETYQGFTWSEHEAVDEVIRKLPFRGSRLHVEWASELSPAVIAVFPPRRSEAWWSLYKAGLTQDGCPKWER